jgi:hypothetical protein
MSLVIVMMKMMDDEDDDEWRKIKKTLLNFSDFWIFLNKLTDVDFKNK